MISRRRLLVVTGGALLGGVKSGFGQERPPWRVGVIHSAFLPGIPSVQGLKAGLKAAGIEEGRHVVFDIRPTRGGQESPLDLAAALVASRVDLIYTNNVQATYAAQTSTSKIPIVFTSVGDPVAAGIVSSFARPGGNVTGIASLSTELVPKQLEIVKALVPRARRVFAVHSAGDPASLTAAHTAHDLAATMGLEVVVRAVRTEEEAVRELKAVRGNDVVMAPLSTDLNITGLVLNLNLYGVAPAIFANAFWVRAGGLVSYGHDDYEEGVQAARLVARILRGARPEDLPVEAVNLVKFAINMKTARFLKLDVPRVLLLRADEVIQ